MQDGGAKGLYVYVNDQYQSKDPGLDMLIQVSGVTGQFTANDLVFN